MGRESDVVGLGVRALFEFADAVVRFRDGLDITPRLLGPFISGVEVTQGIQYYRANLHLTNADDQGPDNSVRLAANKPAWVRVYLRSGLLGGSHDLTGELVVEHRKGPFLALWSTVATLAPQPPGTVATQTSPNYATERSTLGSTLNFILGANLIRGMVRLTVRIWRVGDTTKALVDTQQETVNATMLQTLRLRGIFIAYSGPDPTTNPPTPNVNLPAPTVANLQATAAWTMTTNPVESQGSFSSAGTMNWFMPLTGVATEPGGCSADWLALNYWISLMKLNDGNRNDVIYYGLLPAAVPMQNVGGCESSGVSAGPDAQPVTMAHEVGHGAGLAHGPCGVGNADASYPAYEPYDPANTPTASLGEYGLDITNGTIHPPSDKDYMSYCGPRWISVYHHAKLCFNDKFNPRSVGTQRWRPPDLVDPYLWPWEYIPDPPIWERAPGDLRMKAERLISIVGLVDDAGVLDVRSVMRVEALRGSTNAARTAFVAQLMSEGGEVVASAPVMRLISRGCGCARCDDRDQEAGPFVFEAMVADAEPGGGLRIVRRSSDDRPAEEVWARRAPTRRPRVARFTVKVVRGYGVATWEASGARDCQLEFSLQFSKDNGRSWNGLTVGVRSNAHRFALTDLPVGSVIFRLLAHDGFFSTSAVSRPVVLPPRPPAVSIIHPQPGPALFAGTPMRLWGGVMTDDGTPVAGGACRWRLDGRDVARGVDEFILAPEPGEHRCTFIVKGRGGRAEASVVFRTVDPAETDPTALSPIRDSAARSRRKARRSIRRKR
jgi:hypothetical protein